MSYEPTIICSMPDLQARRAEIESWEYQEPKRKSAKFLRRQEAFKFLHDVIDKYKPFKFKGLLLVIFQPELTSRNKDVRDVLHDMNIEFALDD